MAQRPPTRPTCSPPLPSVLGLSHCGWPLSSPAHASSPLLSPVLSVDRPPPPPPRPIFPSFSSSLAGFRDLTCPPDPLPARCPICPVFGLHSPAQLTQMWHDRVGSEGWGQSHWGSCRHSWGWGRSGLTGSSLVHRSPLMASDGFAPGVGPL